MEHAPTIGALCGGRLAKVKGVRYGPPIASPATCVALTPYDAKRAMLTYVQATEPALSLLPA